MAVEQNIGIALVLASLGGFLNVLATLCLAYPEHRANRYGATYSVCAERWFLVLNLTFQGLNSASNAGSSFFGPVAVVLPATVAAQLFANMIVFGCMRLEEFSKDVIVGTCIVVLSVIFLTIVGPQVQQDQDIQELLTRPIAIAWMSLLGAGVVISGLCLPVFVKKKNATDYFWNYVIILASQVFPGVLSTTLSRMFVFAKGASLGLAILGWLIGNVVQTYGIILQATAVVQGKFAPLNATSTQIINAITGLIIWEDFKAVESWPGYATVMIQLIIGVYLISSLDFFNNTVDPNYGRRQSIAIMMARSSRHNFVDESSSGRRLGRRESRRIGSVGTDKGLFGGSVMHVLAEGEEEVSSKDNSAHGKNLTQKDPDMEKARMELEEAFEQASDCSSLEEGNSKKSHNSDEIITKSDEK